MRWELEDAENGPVATSETLVSVSDLETTSVCQSKMEQQVEFYLLGESWVRNKVLFFWCLISFGFLFVL